MHPHEKTRRRRHTAEFKAAAVAACRKPGTSIAAVALERQINANLLRKWIKGAEAAVARGAAEVVTALSPPTFVPLKLPAPSAPTREEGAIRVHIRKGRSRITIEWPAAASGACAGWLRELLG
jgi:transposase